MCADDNARLRRLSDESWRDLVDSGLVRALQPAQRGGGEVDLFEFYDAVIETGRADGSIAWVLGIIGVHPRMWS